METRKSQQRLTEEFKAEAVRQVTVRGVSGRRSGCQAWVCGHSLNACIKRYSATPSQGEPAGQPVRRYQPPEGGAAPGDRGV